MSRDEIALRATQEVLKRLDLVRASAGMGSPVANVAAPFDGIVTAHLVSVGELVGVASPTQLATIVATDPIYVNFSVNEQGAAKLKLTDNDVLLGDGTNSHSLFSNGGTALVIHADADDMKTDPAGNSGARIACGTVTK